jgi:hypothetical protein
VGEERVEEAREEVEGGRRDAERKREVVRARRRQRQRCLLRLRRRNGVVRAGTGRVVATPALARGGGGRGGSGGGGIEEEEESRGGGGGVGGGEEERRGGRGRHGEGRARMVVVVVRWLSRRCCQTREDFLWMGGDRSDATSMMPCRAGVHGHRRPFTPALI